MYQPPEKLYPFESQWLDIAGFRMHFLDEGPRDAPVVLMVHGNPTWSFYYRNLVLTLRDRYRCIVPDHIGCGLSDKPGRTRYPYTLERRISDLGDLMDHIQPKMPIHMIVHDWGGMIGTTWAARNPDRIKRIVVLNTGNGLKDVVGAMQAVDLVGTTPFRVRPDLAALERVVAGWGGKQMTNDD